MQLESFLKVGTEMTKVQMQNKQEQLILKCRKKEMTFFKIRIGI